MQSDFGLIQSDFEKIFLCVHFNLKYDFILYEIIIYFRLELFENIYPWWDHYSFIWIGKMINVHVQNQCTDGNCVLETWSLNQSLQAGENVALLLVSWQGWLAILVKLRVQGRLFWLVCGALFDLDVFGANCLFFSTDCQCVELCACYLQDPSYSVNIKKSPRSFN